jgi:hypothetical protein
MMSPPIIGISSLYKWEGPLYEVYLVANFLHEGMHAHSQYVCKMYAKCEEEEVPRHNLYQCIQV